MICGVCSTEPCACPREVDRAIYAAALVELQRQHDRAQRESERAATARRMLPAGASRARVTAVNARWDRHAKERDRIARAIKECERRLKGRRQ